MLKNIHIPAQIKRLYCKNLTTVNDQEWVCHRCLNALRDRKVPKLSVANGMKWPNKPPELNLIDLTYYFGSSIMLVTYFVNFR